MISWTTASELGVDRFTVERSADGDAFEAIGSVPAAGNSGVARDYEFADQSPLATGYYRLRIEDMDGSSAYSHVLVVKSATDATATRLQVSPNPNGGTFSVSFAARTAESELVVVDALGREITRRTIASGVAEQFLELGGLPAGTYAVRFVGQEAGGAQRFVVQ